MRELDASFAIPTVDLRVFALPSRRNGATQTHERLLPWIILFDFTEVDPYSLRCPWI